MRKRTVLKNDTDYIGKCFLAFTNESGPFYDIVYIEDISEGFVREKSISVCCDYIDIDSETSVYKFNRKAYRKWICIDQNIYEKVIKDVWKAEKEIECLINQSIIDNRPYQKGDCVVDKEIKSLCFSTDEVLTTGCLHLSFHPYSFSCEDGPMNTERWNDCQNVDPTVFDKAESIYIETTKSIMEYLQEVYN